MAEEGEVQEAMNLGGKSVRRQKKKDLRNQVRQIKKDMLGAGCDKGNTRRFLREFEETLLRAEELSAHYQTAVRHIGQSREAMERLLEHMGERPVRQVRQELQEVSEGMEHIYHDCTVRRDDADFQSSVACFQKLAAGFGNGADAMGELLLRSELENIKAVLDDTAEFRAPDFFALAYYRLHEDGEALKDMEQAQRDLLLEEYLKEHFTEPFRRETDLAGVTERLAQMRQSYLHG